MCAFLMFRDVLFHDGRSNFSACGWSRWSSQELSRVEILGRGPGQANVPSAAPAEILELTGPPGTAPCWPDFEPTTARRAWSRSAAARPANRKFSDDLRSRAPGDRPRNGFADFGPTAGAGGSSRKPMESTLPSQRSATGWPPMGCGFRAPPPPESMAVTTPGLRGQEKIRISPIGARIGLNWAGSR